MKSAVAFLNTPTGRGLRIIAGMLVIGAGIAVGGAGGVVIGVIGLVPIAMGLWGRTLLELLLQAR